MTSPSKKVSSNRPNELTQLKIKEDKVTPPKTVPLPKDRLLSSDDDSEKDEIIAKAKPCPLSVKMKLGLKALPPGPLSYKKQKLTNGSQDLSPSKDTYSSSSKPGPLSVKKRRTKSTNDLANGSDDSPSKPGPMSLKNKSISPFSSSPLTPGMSLNLLKWKPASGSRFLSLKTKDQSITKTKDQSITKTKDEPMTKTKDLPITKAKDKPTTYSKTALPLIPHELFDQSLETEDIVRQVKEKLNKFQISQQSFGELVLGVSSGATVSHILTRVNPWDTLTNIRKKQFIRMKMFLEDEEAIEKLKNTSRTLSKSRKIKIEPESMEAPVVTKTGPRAKIGDKSEYYAVEDILKKWVGQSDRTKKDTFYLVQFKGIKEIDVSKSAHQIYDDYWIHPSMIKECDDMIDRIDRQEEEKEKMRKKKKTKRPRGYLYISEDEEEENSGKSKEMNGFSLNNLDELPLKTRLRAKDDSCSVTSFVAKKKRKKEYHTVKMPNGFDKGVKPVEIIKAYLHKQKGNVKGKRHQLMYMVKFEDGYVDMIHSSVCREKIQDMLVDFLLSKMEGVHSLTSKEIL